MIIEAVGDTGLLLKSRSGFLLRVGRAAAGTRIEFDAEGLPLFGKTPAELRLGDVVCGWKVVALSAGDLGPAG